MPAPHIYADEPTVECIKQEIDRILADNAG